MSTYHQRQKIIKRIIFWSILIGGILALSIPTLVNGQTVEPGRPVDVCNAALGGCWEGTENFSGRDGVFQLIMSVVYFLIYVGAGIAVLFIVIGGYKMVTSNGNSDQYEQGLNSLKGAVLGLIVAIISITIVSLITNIIPTLNLFT